MPDFLQVLLGMINMQAAMIGVAATQAWNFFTPSADNAPFGTVGGGWRARVAPMVSPAVATIVCIVMEWDNRFLPEDISRGLLSGFASEFMLRLYYKTIRGL